ncbi:MAG: MBL fold metallo-hydrolase [Bacteroidales bacterium]|nr:MBL fold metallo-hydrolase [Bacteroidales bacterium]
MKITVLVDNRAGDMLLETEHGLSIYFENQDYKCLLDTGDSDLFVRNAAKLGVDLTDVDYVFISHGHSDHLGGLPFFLKLNSKAKIIVSAYAFNQHFFSRRTGFREIGVNMDISEHMDRFVFVKREAIFMNGNIRVLSADSEKYPFPKGNSTLYKDAGKGLEQDDFNHELIVFFPEDGGLVFTGCGHKGVLNILETVKERTLFNVKNVIGGFHLLDNKGLHQFEDEKDLTEIADVMQTEYKDTHFFCGHCTGELAYKVLKDRLGNQLTPFYTGFALEL